jgi:Xaa-Pro aminopeptidase
MTRDQERINRIADTLSELNLDALVCTLPENVLMLTGYWPVVGTSVAVAARSGGIWVLAPEDERGLASSGWAEVHTYSPGSLDTLTGPVQGVAAPLRAALSALGVTAGSIGLEDTGVYEGATYAAMFMFDLSLRGILTGAAPTASLVAGDDAISRLRSTLTPTEVGCVRQGCAIAGEAFMKVASAIKPGMREPEVASLLRAPIIENSLARPNIQRAEAFTWCMSGPNAALAGAAYARTRNRELRDGDFVLVHCNSTLDGLWTDITRTYVLGKPDARQRSIYEAIFRAREAALAAIRPGVAAAEVDRAARQVLSETGFGDAFTHGVGHNVGYSVISAEFPPRLHPASPDLLAVGMTFNIEPAIYLHGYGAVRQCEVVTVQEDGVDILTPFQSSMDELVLGG